MWVDGVKFSFTIENSLKKKEYNKNRLLKIYSFYCKYTTLESKSQVKKDLFVFLMEVLNS